MKFMKKIFIILISLFIGSFVFAQSADVVTDILQTEEVTYGQVCYLSASRQNLIKNSASYSDAVKALYNAGQIKTLYKSDDKITLEEIAFIFVKIWPGAKDSLMYNLSGGSPRYSCKYLKSLEIIDNSKDPKAKISGREALNILTDCMIEFGSKDECMDLEIGE